jgi:hypothetical protein
LMVMFVRDERTAVLRLHSCWLFMVPSPWRTWKRKKSFLEAVCYTPWLFFLRICWDVQSRVDCVHLHLSLYSVVPSCTSSGEYWETYLFQCWSYFLRHVFLTILSLSWICPGAESRPRAEGLMQPSSHNTTSMLRRCTTSPCYIM